MQKFTTVELLRGFTTVAMAADRQPVAITKHDKPRFVLMTYDAFEAMRRRGDPGRSMLRAKRRRSWSTSSNWIA